MCRHAARHQKDDGLAPHLYQVQPVKLPRNPTRPVSVGSVTIGGGHPIVVQSMCATKTADAEATAVQATALADAGAGVVRIAVDSRREAEVLPAIRERTRANLSVDLQENYRLAADPSGHS